MKGLLALLLIAGLAAAEPAAVRAEAEARLAEARLRLADARAARLAELHAAVTAADAARERLRLAERERDRAVAEAVRRERDRERDLVLARQLADRALAAARLPAAEAQALSAADPAARVAAAIAGIDRRLDALPARLALRRGDETVIGRDGAVATVPVLRLGEARAIALGGGHARRGLLERAADGGSWVVVGPALPETHGDAIPLDAAGTAAHQPGAVRRSLAEWVAAGRAFIWPILGVLALGLLITAARAIALARRRVDPHRLAAVATHLAQGEAAAAQALVAAGTTPLDRVLRAGLAAAGRPREAHEAAVEQALLAETGELTRGLTMLAVLAGVAPLLGLLGTVTGMIDMFSVIAAQGTGSARSLSGGISEALICTQAGMLVAIPLLLAHAVLSRLAERRTNLLEEAACGVLGLAGPRP